DNRVIEFGIGLTDLVKRPTRDAAELTRQDFAEGRYVLSQKLEEFAPRLVAFHGKATYEQYAQRSCKLGPQKEKLYGAAVFVLPAAGGANTAARAQKLKVFKQLARWMQKMEGR
ncbi:MAG TPA: mismatch-specific DNA-glycosylase, partial [Methylomirabilota bacterium]|nr:mismatch-specific DNA-glycosylase [Methylomirabilota bacterium]